MLSQRRHESTGTRPRRQTIGNRLYLSVLSLFLVFAAAFIVFQQYREKQYKVEMLDMRLQDYNNHMHETFANDTASITELPDEVRTYLAGHSISGLRVTIILKDGRVVFDSANSDVSSMGNHAGRSEVMEALKKGNGSTVDRISTTLKQDYFYSATYYPQDGYIIRSALPYDLDLAKSLHADQHYLWFALAVMLMLTIILYQFIHRLGRNITQLNDFAAKASLTPSPIGEDWSESLGKFSNDELGDTAERIVKLYLQLRRTQQEQNILKQQLTQNVTHELKTPVASIQGYLETILENPKVDEATRRQFLERCYAQSKRLTSLLADMSMLNRIDDGAKMMTFEEVDVAELICTVEKESQFALGQKGMTMTCDIPEHIIVHGNRSLLYSVFRNLTDNAIAYAGQGTHISLICQPADAGSRSAYRFTFSDNGIGVAPEHLPRLFERFYRVDKGRSRKMGGTGLGLAIVKNAVLLHGGTISVKNRDGGGLQFGFSLSATLS